MIDRGLLITMVAMVVAVLLAARGWPPRLARDDTVIGRGFAGIAVGALVARLVAVALADPSAFTRPGDLLVIRGGMEFWPGVAAGITACAVAARRAKVPAVAEMADLAPYSLAAYAVFEASCVFRDGCFGPVSAIGLRPGGVGPTEIPVGLGVALAAAGLAVLVRRIAGHDVLMALLVAVFGLATARAAAAAWLPKIGSAPSRPQVESVIVAALALASGGFVVVARRLRTASVEPVRPASGAARPFDE